MGKLSFHPIHPILEFIIIYTERCNWFLHSHQPVSDKVFASLQSFLRVHITNMNTRSEGKLAQHTDSRVNYLRKRETSPINFNKCYIAGMIDHSINFQINLFHNVSAPMSFHFLCFAPHSFDASCFVHALFILWEGAERKHGSQQQRKKL